MKRVDVIFPAYINATIGPTGTLRRLLTNKEYIASRGYELQVFTYDFLKSKGKKEKVDYSKGLTLRSKVKSLIKKKFVVYNPFFEKKAKNSREIS